jgi:glutamate-ammonia-ligase adenylyltransferase
MLVVSLDAFAAYQREEAWTWEHMALTRARPLFGSKEACDRSARLIQTILHQERNPATVAADAAQMRGDIARHKPPAGLLDVKLGSGGLVDLEFVVHVLQLTHRTGFDPRLEHAVEALAAAELLDARVADWQKLLTRILIAMRLVAPDGHVPTSDTCSLIAQVCGFQHWDELLARHDEARQGISTLWEDMKGGSK